jgi:hypothetical protein
MGSQRHDPGGIDLVDVAASGAPACDETGLPQNAQVLGDGRTADGKLLGQLAYGLGASCEQLEYLTPPRISESIENPLLVSCH